MKKNNSFGSAVTPIRLANIFKILPLLAMLSVVGCSEDLTEDDGDDVSGNTVVEIFGYSVYPTDPTTARFVYDSYVTLTHLSENATSLELVLDGGVAFLNDNFDSEATELSTEVDESKGTTSSATQESVVFTTPGYATVTLKAEFTENISDGTSGISVKLSEDNDGYWKLVKEFEVPVFSKELSPVITVSDGDDEEYEFTADELTAETPDVKEVDIYVGGSVTFTDSTTEEGYNSNSDKLKLSALGSALGRTWSNSEGVIITNDTEESTTLTFSAEGVYEAFWVTVNRTKPTAVATTSGELYIPVKITVSDIPLNSVSVSNLAVTNVDGGALNEITLITSASFGEVGTTLSVGNYAGFIVGVTNTNGTSVGEIIVTGARIDDTDNTKLILTLSDNIYSDDEVTLSFTAGESNAFVVGTNSLSDFANEVVAVTVEGILSTEGYGFECGASTIRGTFVSDTYWYAVANGAYISYAEDPTNSENTVAMIDATSGALSSVQINPKTTYAADVPAGSYTFSFRYYIDAQATLSNKFSIQTTKGATVASATSLPSYELDSWQTATVTVTYDVDQSALQYRLILTASSTTIPLGAIFYVDDLQLTQIRPTN